MMNISNRIRQKRLELKISQQALSEKCGWDSAGRVSNYENGSRNPKASDVVVIAKALNVSPEWLQFGKPSFLPEGAISSNIAEPIKPMGKIPILTWDEVLRIKFEGNQYYMENNATNKAQRDYLLIYSEYPEGSFGLEVQGDSMTSPHPFSVSFTDGMMLYVNPVRKPENGNYVICAFNEKEAAFRQYVIDSGVEYLKPLNPQYPLRRLDECARIIGVIMECNLKLI